MHIDGKEERSKNVPAGATAVEFMAVTSELRKGLYGALHAGDVAAAVRLLRGLDPLLDAAVECTVRQLERPR